MCRMACFRPRILIKMHPLTHHCVAPKINLPSLTPSYPMDGHETIHLFRCMRDVCWITNLDSSGPTSSEPPNRTACYPKPGVSTLTLLTSTLNQYPRNAKMSQPNKLDPTTESGAPHGDPRSQRHARTNLEFGHFGDVGSSRRAVDTKACLQSPSLGGCCSPSRRLGASNLVWTTP